MTFGMRLEARIVCQLIRLTHQMVSDSEQKLVNDNLILLVVGALAFSGAYFGQWNR